MYPVVLAVKTPRAFPHRRTWIPVSFAAGILLVALESHIDIGVRPSCRFACGFPSWRPVYGAGGGVGITFQSSMDFPTGSPR
jgi:hypothetical protein